MTRSVGIDLVELSRLSGPNGDRFAKRVLSDEEHAFYEGITDQVRRLTYLGGRFAAKEALFKALPSQDGKANYNDITITADAAGKPVVRSLLVPEGHTVHLSITHTEQYAAAFVILESDVT